MKKNMISRALLVLRFAAAHSRCRFDSLILIVPKNENESYGYADSPQQPWSEYRVHDPSRPIPKKLNPTPNLLPRSSERRHRPL